MSDWYWPPARRLHGLPSYVAVARNRPDTKRPTMQKLSLEEQPGVSALGSAAWDGFSYARQKTKGDDAFSDGRGAASSSTPRSLRPFTTKSWWRSPRSLPQTVVIATKFGSTSVPTFDPRG